MGSISTTICSVYNNDYNTICISIIRVFHNDNIRLMDILKTYKRLEKELELACNEADGKLNKIFSLRKDIEGSYREWYESPEYLKFKEINRVITLIKIPIMYPIKPDSEEGMIQDYDGVGSYANEKEVSNIPIYPSDIKAGIYRYDFTHIMWFNR